MIRVLFTGTSSFTGLWFIRALHAAGIEVIATCHGPAANADRLRASRLSEVGKVAEPIYDRAFGSALFLDTLERHGPFDAVCLHGAEVGDHRRQDFDVASAVAANTNGLIAVLDRLAALGCRHVMTTGTVFEAGEGRGVDALGGYGLAKTLTWQALRDAAGARDIVLGKFVIPHPVGPYEKPGLTTYLARAWQAGEVPLLGQPHLVRDVIHVELLALAYRRAILELLRRVNGSHRFAPSGHVAPTMAFVARLAGLMRPVLGLPCRFALAADVVTGPPILRCNTDLLRYEPWEWQAERAWQSYAAYLGQTTRLAEYEN